MFSLCFCSTPKRSKFDTHSKYYPQIKIRRKKYIEIVNDDEQVMLELIYNDLASRNAENLLTS